MTVTNIKKTCARDGCNEAWDIKTKRDQLKKYCCEYCNKRTWDLKNRTPKKFMKVQQCSKNCKLKYFET